MNRVLVTGGAGFLGSHVCAELMKSPDNTVTALDDLSTGKRENIASLLPLDRFEFFAWDVRRPFDRPVDQIYHAACPASPKAYQRSPTSTTKTCVLGTLNMLELAKKYNAKFLQFSTSEVYGNPLLHPQKEEYFGNVNPIGVRSCYDEGKRCAESLCFDYAREFGVKVKIVRIFNTYGPRMAVSDGRVVSNFVVQALRGEDITIYGDGQQTRSFQYVSDLIEGMLRVMATGDDFTGPVNLGNPGEFTMLELAEKVIKKIGGKSKIVFRPLPSDDPKMRRPDIAKAKSELGWEPKVTLDEGLDHIIQYFREYLKL